MKKTTLTDNADMTRNLYSLPDGTILVLPAHCTDACERFALADRTLVWAVRVEGDQGAEAQTSAARLSRDLGAPRNLAAENRRRN
jgi:hypothetical protein